MTTGRLDVDKYVVAWISFFDHEVKQTIIEAESEPEAVIQYVRTELDNLEWAYGLSVLRDTAENNDEWLQAIHRAVFDSDATFNVMKL